MAKEHDYHPSIKVGINRRDHFIITRGNTVYLRLIGENPKYLLMTATADEDSRKFIACKDKTRLISVAWQFALSQGFEPKSCSDNYGREYVKILEFNIDHASDQSDLFEHFDQAIKHFFEIYDNFIADDAGCVDEMRDIYRELASDDLGGDVYLSDGVWLSSDGSLHDRGR